VRFIGFEQLRSRLNEIINYSKAAGHHHYNVRSIALATYVEVENAAFNGSFSNSFFK